MDKIEIRKASRQEAPGYKQRPYAPKGWVEMECGGQRQKQGLSEE